MQCTWPVEINTATFQLDQLDFLGQLLNQVGLIKLTST